MKKEWLKRRPVRVGLTAGILTPVVLAALWLCGVFSPAPELPPPSQALIEAWDGLDAVYVEASLDTDASAMTARGSPAPAGRPRPRLIATQTMPRPCSLCRWPTGGRWRNGSKLP